MRNFKYLNKDSITVCVLAKIRGGKKGSLLCGLPKTQIAKGVRLIDAWES